MEAVLPDFVIPRRAGAAGLVVSGQVPGARFERLMQAYPLSSAVTVDLVFSAEGDRRVWLTGTLEAKAQVQCQRCLETFPALLKAEVDVGFGPPLEDDAREVLSGLDDELALWPFIEDELLLGAPMVHRHAAGACGMAADSSREEALEVGSPSQTRRPFEQLGSLLAGHESKSKTGD